MLDAGDMVDAVSRATREAACRVMAAGHNACEAFNGIVDGSMAATDVVGVALTEAANRMGIRLQQHAVVDGITFVLPFVTGAAGYLVARRVYRGR